MSILDANDHDRVTRSLGTKLILARIRFFSRAVALYGPRLISPLAVAGDRATATMPGTKRTLLFCYRLRNRRSVGPQRRAHFYGSSVTDSVLAVAVDCVLGVESRRRRTGDVGRRGNGNHLTSDAQKEYSIRDEMRRTRKICIIEFIRCFFYCFAELLGGGRRRNC